MLELIHIHKRYQYQKVLKDISLILPDCGMIAIVGASGCGKSTLLHIIGGIDDDFQGELYYQQQRVTKCLTSYRRKNVSFIFQQFHLIMWLTVTQNIHLPHFFHRQARLTNQLDIESFKGLEMSSLSLGQRQRIAYLRAYFHNCHVLLCDEPTGALDQKNAQQVMELLKKESQSRLVVVVSHDLKLVKNYCDEIYEMEDGQITNHHLYHQHECKLPTIGIKKRKLFSHFRLSIKSLCSHKSRTLQLVFGLTISLICIVLTLTMSQGLEQQMTQYIYSLVPSSGISFQSSHHQSLTQSFATQLQKLPEINKVQLYLDDYECLGVGFQAKRYQESETLFIGDDTSPFEHLGIKVGRYPQNNNEIMLSLSTAKHLCKDDTINLLIDKTLYAWYKHGNTVKSIAYRVVGISNQTTTLDTLYQKENSYIHLLKDVYGFDEKNVKSSLGIIYVEQNYARSDVIKQLQRNYPDYKYLEIGSSTTQNISETMQRVRIVLYLFSGLAILASLFLVGEVMFLNAVQKKKDLAIMKCFGASSFDLLRIVLYESLEILCLSQIFCTIIYNQLLIIANSFAQQLFTSENQIFLFDKKLLLLIYSISFVLIFISQIPPLLYVLRLNTVSVLKE